MKKLLQRKDKALQVFVSAGKELQEVSRDLDLAIGDRELQIEALREEKNQLSVEKQNTDSIIEKLQNLLG